ncbi:MAG: multiubiquitin domain-containing protein [Desulfuromonadales bacterium]|nr:multiubiquitin domain-containing protein [Desulfuromonadales bacterium]MDH3867742.1 multiubiquitin domain-containing protein [Desulfuromonadales bacterium]MDH3959641.1 multiubiquitin domain-containing protein [Desulfuromonadales bacterium]MDH4024414.1 multiubiquitin domain-containing protein [Desulfuromonadales bacterium]
MSNEHSEQAPGQNKVSTIIVNGREREVTGKQVNYRQVVQLAFPGDQTNNDIEYTVAYSNPHGKDGTLVDGEDTQVKGGMIFNVNKTNRS